MSADFWAGYISGAIGIIVGNPLDLIKVRLQATHSAPTPSTPTNTPPSALTLASQFSSASSLIRGASAPILGYGALNALLFVTYNRTSQFLVQTTQPLHNTTPNLTTTFLAGAIGGLATWVVSTPTELIKCRAQLSSSGDTNSLTITRQILRTEGIRGLYFGGAITALRDSIGYGFYFWSYELSTRYMASRFSSSPNSPEANDRGVEAAKVLLCGGLAGVMTWLSIFPLDVIKTRVQMQIPTVSSSTNEQSPLLSSQQPQHRLGAIEIAKTAYRNEGAGVFFRGLVVCSIRAFFVNAVQWAVYEWIMRELSPAVVHQEQRMGGKEREMMGLE